MAKALYFEILAGVISAVEVDGYRLGMIFLYIIKMLISSYLDVLGGLTNIFFVAKVAGYEVDYICCFTGDVGFCREGFGPISVGIGW